jgi:hypothetical protein
MVAIKNLSNLSNLSNPTPPPPPPPTYLYIIIFFKDIPYNDKRLQMEKRLHFFKIPMGGGGRLERCERCMRCGNGGIASRNAIISYVA